MTLNLLKILRLFLISFSIVNGFGFLDPEDAGLTTTQLLNKYKYPVEEHEVQTEDGYILTIHRIPQPTSSKPPVLLMHGTFCDSAVWLTLGPNRSLPYQLHDRGYDVWLGNQRGSIYSRKHVNLDPEINPQQFFNYSLNEIGRYDVKAKVDHILNQTGQSKIIHIGHAFGVTDAFVLASELPEYNEKFLLLLGLSPAAYLTNLKAPLLRVLSLVKDELKAQTDLLGVYEYFSPNPLFTQFKIAACSPLSPFREMCAWILFLMAGIDSEQLERDRLPVIYTVIPSPTSTKELDHIFQLTQSTKFSKYDYGENDNIQIYGQAQPPNYNISKITAPVLLYYGQNDWIADVKDVERLASELSNLTDKILLTYEKTNHIDFIWAEDINEILYNDILLKLDQTMNT